VMSRLDLTAVSRSSIPCGTRSVARVDRAQQGRAIRASLSPDPVATITQRPLAVNAYERVGVA